MDTHGFGAHRVQGIADDDTAGADGDHAIEDGRAVIGQHLALVTASGLQCTQFGAALGKAQEHRQHQAAQQQPLRWGDAHAGGAGENAQHEAGGDDKDIEYHHMLEAQAVGGVKDEVGGDDGERRR